MNLISLCSEWLCRNDSTKSIQVRTKDVLWQFTKYINKQSDSFFQSISIEKKTFLGIIDKVSLSANNILTAYLDGNIVSAITEASDLLSKLNMTQNSEKYYYRARDNDKGFLYKPEEMFHIPYHLRHKISNQRFSTSGLPCLYLGSSTYLCWEELERPDYQKCNFLCLRAYHPLWVFNICIPQVISTQEDVFRTCIALICSLKADKDHNFKLEYIIPQCILQSITSDPRFSHDGIGIQYYSIPYLHKDSSTFTIDFENVVMLKKFVNIVIPAQAPRKKGLSPLLKRMFSLGTPESIMSVQIKSILPKESESGLTDEYNKSIFGQLDAYLQGSTRKEVADPPLF